MKEFLKTNAITLASGSLAAGIICAGVSLSGNFDNQLHYCDSTFRGRQAPQKADAKRVVQVLPPR